MKLMFALALLNFYITECNYQIIFDVNETHFDTARVLLGLQFWRLMIKAMYITFDVKSIAPDNV